MEIDFANAILQPKQLEPAVETQVEVFDQVIMSEIEEQDDDCVICYQTLYRPARTECGHSACESCLLHWALTAMETKFAGDKAPEVPSNIAIAVDGIKFKCPTCRTYTQATFDTARDKTLAKRYPEEYTSRESEIAASSPLKSEDGSELAVLMIGNSHQKISARFDPLSGLDARHEWTFFVKASSQEAIEKVEVILHPNYRENRLAVLNKAPFTITRLSDAYFVIFAGIVLKEGWEWIGEDMTVDSDPENGRVRDRLPVKWLLDFNGGGSMKTQTVKVKRAQRTLVEDTDIVIGEPCQKENGHDDEADADLASLAAFMSESEVAQLREVRRMKREATKDREALAKSK